MISYGGVILKEPPPEFIAWLVNNMPPQEAFSFYRPRWLGDPQLDARSHFDWFLSRPVRLNTFYNPWGASRWGIGYFLVDETGLAAIRAQAYADGGYVALPLVMDDETGDVEGGGTGDPLETDLFMLPAIPLTGPALSATDVAVKLYLLVLVDERFFWWERGAEVEVDEGTTTWAQLFTAIGTGLGVTITHDTVSSAYLEPTAEMGRNYQHLPLLLDLAAESVGLRIVRTLAGAIVAQTPTAAATAAAALVTSEDAGELIRVAGGVLDVGASASVEEAENDTPANVPATVTVVFPRANGGLLSATGAVEAVPVTLAGLALAEYEDHVGRPGAVQVIHSAAIANFVGGGPTPDNDAELTALAEQIATDWYLWRAANVEVRYRGAVAIESTGMRDVEWLHGGCSPGSGGGGMVTSVRRATWEPIGGVLGHVGAAVYDSSVHIWANCTIDDDFSVPVVVANSHIPFVTGLGSGRYLFEFDVDFGNLENYTIAGIVDGNDYFREIKAARTSASCILQTGSETDPADAFGITIHGRLGEPEDDGPDDIPDIDTGGDDDPAPNACNNCGTHRETYCVEFTGIANGDSMVCECLLGDAFLLRDWTYFTGDPTTAGCQWVNSPRPGYLTPLLNPYFDTAIAPCQAERDADPFNLLNVPLWGFNLSLTIENTWNWATLEIVIYEFRAHYPGATEGAGYPVATMIYNNETITFPDSLEPAWACDTPRVLTRVGGSTDSAGMCTNWPATVTIYPCGGLPPTLTFSDTDICQDDTEIVLTGTHFDILDPTANLVTFNLGASGHVTAATYTQLTVEFDVAPTSLGALTATVTTGMGTTETIQVGTAVGPCAPSPTFSILGSSTSGVTEVTDFTMASVTVAGGMLVVLVTEYGDTTTISDVTYAGITMTQGYGSSVSGTAWGDGNRVKLYYLAVTADTGDIVVTKPSGTAIITVQVIEILGLINNTHLSSHSGNGNGFPPTDMMYAGGSFPIAGVCGFTIRNAGAAWAWLEGFSSATIDVNTSYAGEVGDATVGTLAYGGGGGDFDPGLSGITPTGWAGVAALFS